MDNYQVFAIVYDDLMDKSLYQQWFNYTKKRIKPASSILELAGGSGDLAKLLLNAGYQVTLSDLSDKMLDLAIENLADIKQDIDIFQIDMTDFSLPTKFDNVICFDDSICYLKDEDQLRQTFSNVYQVLKPGGKFLFDCHSLFQMDQIFPEYMFNEINDDYTFVWKSFVGEVPHSIEHDLQIFVPIENSDNKFQMYEEIHHERTYPIDTYRKLLVDCGFEILSITSDFSDQLDEQTGKRWFFECERV